MKTKLILAAAAASAALISAGAASADLSPEPPRGAASCLFLITSDPPAGAMPRILAEAPSLGRARQEQRLFSDDGIPTRIGRVCSWGGARRQGAAS